jgi:hypothetical protein
MEAEDVIGELDEDIVLRYNCQLLDGLLGGAFVIADQRG